MGFSNSLIRFFTREFQRYRRRLGFEPEPKSYPTFDFSRLDPNKETILLAVHNASRSGAPLLAYNISCRLQQKYNVVVILLGDGELVNDFRKNSAAVVGPLNSRDSRYPKKIDRIVHDTLRLCSPAYAVLNSIECRALLRPLNQATIPTVTLVHEFSAYIKPVGSLGQSLELSTHIIFSAETVAKAAVADYPNLACRKIHILPQGRVEVPPRPLSLDEERLLRTTMRPEEAKNALVVLGCGMVQNRKGVDIFISCANEIAKMTDRQIRFVWIGSAPFEKYNRGVVKEVKRSNNVFMLNEVSNLRLAYELADIFFLSSRLDPLPNVCIDAAFSGLPVLCFEGATGFADYLRHDPAAKDGIIADMDPCSAARVIMSFAEETARKRLGNAMCSMAKLTFNMDKYIQEIDRLGQSSCTNSEKTI